MREKTPRSYSILFMYLTKGSWTQYIHEQKEKKPETKQIKSGMARHISKRTKSTSANFVLNSPTNHQGANYSFEGNEVSKSCRHAHISINELRVSLRELQLSRQCMYCNIIS